MNPPGRIRVKSYDELCSSDSSNFTISLNKPVECVDLTIDVYSERTLKASSKSNRLSLTRSKKSNKDVSTQTTLDTFFKQGPNILKAPKKRKNSTKYNDFCPPAVIRKDRAKRDCNKNTTRRKLISEIEENQPPKNQPNSHETSSQHIKSVKVNESNKLPPVDTCTLVPIIELSSDSDDDDKKPLKRQLDRPPILVSEKSICPSYKVVEGTTFAVDAFNFGRIKDVTAYFLTHFHADHYIGLTRKFSMPIYTSQITSNLLREFIPVDEKLVHILQVDSTVSVENVSVTALDANHCPGAVMLLFQLPNGKQILHTGDFRASIEMEMNKHLKSSRIDVLYLDTTYISNKYSFQSQTQSIADGIQLVRGFKEMNQNKRILFACGTYLIGKEKFWLSLVKAFDFKIWTDNKRRKIIKAISLDEMDQRLVSDPREADMHIIPMTKVGHKSINDYWSEFRDAYDMIYAIRPSGWEKNSRPRYSGDINIVGVEYSEHSSHNELRRFVSFIRPGTVISTVPTGKDITKCSQVPLSWYKPGFFSPIKKQASIYNYFEVKKT